MEKKIALIDLDGTLLTHGSKISKNNLEGIKKFISLGNQIAICTGRWPVSAFIFNDIIEKHTNHKNTYLISLNGALIYNLLTNEIIYESIISYLLFNELNSIINNKYALWIYTKNGIETKRIFTKKINLKWLMNKFNYGKIVTIDSLAEDDHIYKILVFNFKPFLQKKFKKFGEEISKIFNGRLTISLTSKYCIEITALNTSKGSALDFLSKKDNIKKKNFITVGDSGNDISMFEKAGLKVCIGNKNNHLTNLANINMKRKGGVANALDLATNINYNFDDNKTLLLDFRNINYFKKIQEYDFNKFIYFWAYINNEKSIYILSDFDTEKKKRIFGNLDINNKINFLCWNDIQNTLNEDVFFDVHILKKIINILNEDYIDNLDSFLRINYKNQKCKYIFKNDNDAENYKKSNNLSKKEFNYDLVQEINNLSLDDNIHSIFYYSDSFKNIDIIKSHVNVAQKDNCIILTPIIKQDIIIDYLQNELSKQIIYINVSQVINNQKDLFQEINNLIKNNMLI